MLVTLPKLETFIRNTGLTWTYTKYLALEKDLNSYKKVIVDLQEEVKDMNTTYSHHSISLFDMQKVVQDVFERQRSQYIVLFFGCEQPPSRRNKEQLVLDRTFIKEGFSELGVPDEELQPVRLGKFDITNQNRRRP